jgi:hypothetical protein
MELIFPSTRSLFCEKRVGPSASIRLRSMRAAHKPAPMRTLDLERFAGTLLEARYNSSFTQASRCACLFLSPRDLIQASFSSNLPDFFFYEVEKETDKPNSEAIDLFRSTGL